VYRARWYRNIFSHVLSTKVREIAAMLKAIHASEDVVAAREKAVRVIEKLHGFRLTKAAELAEAGVAETLTYYAFPEEHWRRIRTTDVIDTRRALTRRKKAWNGPGALAAAHAASTSMARACARPCLLIRPCWAKPRPDCRTRGLSPT
jgi:hypothetical protein